MIIDLTADEAETVMSALGGMDLWSPKSANAIEAEIDPIRLKLAEMIAKNGFSILEPHLRPDKSYIEACFIKQPSTLSDKA